MKETRPPLMQAIVYAAHSGRLRSVWVEHEPDLAASLEQRTGATRIPGESVLMFNPAEHPVRRYHEWQTEVSRVCGKLPRELHPEIEATVLANLDRVTLDRIDDRAVEVAPDGSVVAVHFVVPGEQAPRGADHKLIAHSEADDRWRYDHAAARFIAP